MKHFWITFFSALVFFITALFMGSFPMFSAAVSRETATGDVYRRTPSVKQGVSQNGLLAVTAVPAVPSVPPRMKAANHERTLRAFIAPNRGGVLTLYVERAKPHEYYSLVGSFVLEAEYPVITWTNATTLVFYGSGAGGTLMRYEADLHLLTFFETPVSPSALPTISTSLEGILP